VTLTNGTFLEGSVYTLRAKLLTGLDGVPLGDYILTVLSTTTASISVSLNITILYNIVKEDDTVGVQWSLSGTTEGTVATQLQAEASLIRNTGFHPTDAAPVNPSLNTLTDDQIYALLAVIVAGTLDMNDLDPRATALDANSLLIAQNLLGTTEPSTITRAQMVTWLGSYFSNVQADWDEVDTADSAYIQNKPTLGTAAPLDVPASGDAAAVQVVKGNDTRLADERAPTAHADTHVGADAIQDATIARKGMATAAQIIALEAAATAQHTQGTDQGLDTAGANAVTAAEAKAGYTHSGVVAGNPHAVTPSEAGADPAGTASGLMSTHTTTHPVPTTRDARNEKLGEIAAHADLTTGVHGVGTGTIAEVADIPAASSANPIALGSATPGDGIAWSRDNHVHPTTGLKLSGDAPTAHAATHVDGTDDIQDATIAQKGMATAAQIIALEAATSALVPPANTVVVAKSGGDYTTIQAALTANATADTLFLVYPGTYDGDTINFTANNQCIKGMACAPKNVLLTHTATICDYGAFTGCIVDGIKMVMTLAASAKDVTVTGAGGSCNFKSCHVEAVVSGTPTSGAGSACYDGVGVTVKVVEGSVVYTNTATRGSSGKKAVNIEAGSTWVIDDVQFTVAGSGTSSTMSAVRSTSTGTVELDKCTIDVVDSGSTATYCLSAVNGSGDTEAKYNDIHVTNNTGVAAGGYFDSDDSSLSFRSSFNHVHVVSSGGTANSIILADTHVSVVSQFDDFVAANGVNNTAAGSYIFANSPTDGTLGIGILQIGTGGPSVDELSTDGTLEGGSDTAVPTEKAIKAYADTKYRQQTPSASEDKSGASVAPAFASALTIQWALTANLTSFAAATGLADGETGMVLITIGAYSLPADPPSSACKGAWTVTGTLARVIIERVGSVYLWSADSLTVVA